MSFIKSLKDKNPQERAIYNSPDNVFNWSWPQVPRHKFIKEKEEAYKSDDKSLLIPLDISDTFCQLFILRLYRQYWPVMLD